MDSDTPLQKIKFTPLMKSLENASSKCCLEIVPEISCIRNLEGIELNKGDHFIEYTIPLTYKITLKKDLVEKKESLELKTYHSCVDLVDDPLITDSCKDLIRMLSDNKMVSHYGNVLKENKTKLSVREKKDACECTNEQLIIYIDGPSNQSLSKKHDKCTSSASDVNIFKNTNISDKIDKKETKSQCNTGSGEDLIGVVRNSSTATDELTFDKRLALGSIYSFSTYLEGDNHKKKLSISPVFSISAGKGNSPVIVEHERIANGKTFICPQHSMPAQSELNVVNNDYKTVVGKFGRFNSYYKDRIPPDVKLAYYRQLMEKEVRPLKTTLNNIFQKCVVLGVHEQLRQVACKPVDSNFANHQIVRKPIYDVNVVTGEPNRVVYDIVFEG